ncbi:hypothetical protein [Shewanella sp. ALD9]|nr:hypothetical protein [Shewanella sp. ALD9]
MSRFELSHSSGDNANDNANDNADDNAGLPATQAQLIKKIAKM